MRPGVGYEVFLLDSGECDIWKDGRILAYGIPDLDAALSFIELAVGRTTVTLIDVDGYRAEVPTS